MCSCSNDTEIERLRFLRMEKHINSLRNSKLFYKTHNGLHGYQTKHGKIL